MSNLPYDENVEIKGGTNLDAPSLVMHIMVSSIVPEKVLQRVEWKGVTAVVVDRFHSGEGEEKHSTTCFKSRDLVSDTCTERVHQETLEWVIVKCAKSVRHVEAVVS